MTEPTTGPMTELASRATSLLAENLPKPFANITVTCLKGNTLSRGVLERFDLNTYKCIMILADTSREVGEPDARTLMTLLLLRQLQKERPKERHFRIVSEIIKPGNWKLLTTGIDTDIVISPAVISMRLAQISQQQMLHNIYEDLLDVGGNKIYLKPAEHYVQLGVPCQFKDLMAAALARGEIACGVCLGADEADAGRNYGIQLNPPKEKSWTLSGKDRVVVLAMEMIDQSTADAAATAAGGVSVSLLV